MIKQIIEKYHKTYHFILPYGIDASVDAISPDNFPALEQELEQEMENRAVAFAEWCDDNDFRQSPAKVIWEDMQGIHAGTTADLYSQFKQQ